MPSADPLDNGTPFVSQANWIMDPDDTYVIEPADPSAEVTGTHNYDDMFQANIQAITGLHKGIEIHKAFGFICTLEPNCNKKVSL